MCVREKERVCERARARERECVCVREGVDEQTYGKGDKEKDETRNQRERMKWRTDIHHVMEAERTESDVQRQKS